MIKNFEHLSENELQILKSAVPQITVLIAGADGELEKGELKWAEKVAEIRSYKMHNDLIEFYQEVGKTFHDDLEKLIEELSIDQVHRQGELVGKLASVDAVMAKLNPETGAKLYRSFLSFAKHVAKASGGVLGFFSIGPAEKKLIQLPMITPIVSDSSEEE